MTFWQLLTRVTPKSPRSGFAALYWFLTGRRVRARNILRSAAASMSFAYRYWIEEVECRNEPNGGLRRSSHAVLKHPIMVLLQGNPSTPIADLQRSIASLRAQIMPQWQMIVADVPNDLLTGVERMAMLDPAAGSGFEILDQASALTGAGYLMLLKPGDVLPPWALTRFAEGLAEVPNAILLYGDHDHLDERGDRVSPWFKPDWNEEMFLAQDFVSRACLLRASSVRDILIKEPRPQSLYELLLKLVQGTGDRIVHVPHITLHAANDEREEDAAERAAAVVRQLAPLNLTAAEGQHGSVKVNWPLPEDPPLVSIIIPTKDKLELLEPCVTTVLTKTDYPAFEILIVDNGSREERTLSYLKRVAAHPRVRVLPHAIPYNYSALNNFAVGLAHGSFVCLLNNDTEVLTPEWLSELMRQAIRPDVAAVGAKLLYDDGSIQHAGVVVGMGDAAGHIHRFESNDLPGYFAQHHVTQEITAVTGACLLVAKSKYLAVGGLDEEGLAIAYNDIDFCLKLREFGWRNIYVPHATLLHHESKSRIKDHAPSQFERYSRELRLFQSRWKTAAFRDPMLNPNHDRSSETLVVRLS